MAEELTINRERELEVVKTAYYLENNLADLNKEYKRLNQPVAPSTPKLLEVKPQEPKYPEITVSGTLFNDISFLKSEAFKKWGALSIGLFAGGWILSSLLWKFVFLSAIAGFGAIVGFFMFLYSLFLFLKDRKTVKTQRTEEYINSVKNSEDYKNTCKEIDKQCQAEYEQRKSAAQEAFEKETKEYEAEKKEYDEVKMPQYYEEKEALSTAINDAKATLDEFYNTNKIIPAQYHNIPALAWIALYMNTSSFDLKNAIERWDTYVMQCQQREHIELAEAQVNVLREQLTNQSYSNWLQEQLIDLTENGNKTLKSISNWQKTDLAVREYRRIKARRNKR